MKWESVFWDNTHVEGFREDDLYHVGIADIDGQRVVVLRLGEDSDESDAKSFTILLDDDQVSNLIGDLRMSARSL